MPTNLPEAPLRSKSIYGERMKRETGMQEQGFNQNKKSLLLKDIDAFGVPSELCMSTLPSRSSFIPAKLNFALPTRRILEVAVAAFLLLLLSPLLLLVA